MSEPTTFPLAWPKNWPRAKYRQQSKFKAPDLKKACEKIEDETTRLGVKKVIISTNLKASISGKATLESKTNDVGAAVYFNLKETPIALACDAWNRVADNLWAIACHIENMRSQVRWGVGSLEQAFSGYKALPEHSGGSLAWWQVFGYSALVDVKPSEIKERYRRLAEQHHPDRGGDPKRMTELNLAYAEGTRWLKDHNITI